MLLCTKSTRSKSSLQKKTASAITASVINTEKKWLQWLFPVTEIQSFEKQKENNIIEVKIYTLKIRNVIPCKASETRTMSFIQRFASWSYEPVESCMQ